MFPIINTNTDKTVQGTLCNLDALTQFWHERTECKPTNSISSSKSLNFINSIIIERPRTHGTPQNPSQWTNLQ